MTRVALLVIGVLLCRVAAAIPPVPEIPAFPAIHSGNKTYHVQNEIGKDTVNDGSDSKPWKTIGYASGRLTAGDTLIMHGTRTTYPLDGMARMNSGTEARWITIRGRDGPNGERAALAGRLSLGSKATAGASYIYLDNLLFQGGGSGMNIFIQEHSHHLVFDAVEIDCQSSPENRRGVWSENNIHHVWFRDVKVHHCGYLRNAPGDPPPPGWKPPTDCGGICVKGDNVREVVFLAVRVSDNVGDGIGGGSKRAYGSTYFKDCIAERNTGDGFDPGGDLAVIVNCISRNNGGHQGAGYKFWSGESWLINSVAYHNASVGVMVRPRNDGGSSAYILNSTFALNASSYCGGICTAWNDPANGKLSLYVFNNIFDVRNTTAIVISNNKTQIIREEGHNYYFSDSGMSRKPGWAHQHAVQIRDGKSKVVNGYTFKEMSDKGRWSADTGNGVGNIGEISIRNKPDPGFRDLAGGDLRLAAGSRAIDAGVSVGIVTDIVGTAVPTGPAPDMGAYEFTDHDKTGDTILDVRRYGEGWFRNENTRLSHMHLMSHHDV